MNYVEHMVPITNTTAMPWQRIDSCVALQVSSWFPLGSNGIWGTTLWGLPEYATFEFPPYIVIVKSKTRFPSTYIFLGLLSIHTCTAYKYAAFWAVSKKAGLCKICRNLHANLVSGTDLSWLQLNQSQKYKNCRYSVITPQPRKTKTTLYFYNYLKSCVQECLNIFFSHHFSESNAVRNVI